MAIVMDTAIVIDMAIFLDVAIAMDMAIRYGHGPSLWIWLSVRRYGIVMALASCFSAGLSGVGNVLASGPLHKSMLDKFDGDCPAPARFRFVIAVA